MRRSAVIFDSRPRTAARGVSQQFAGFLRDPWAPLTTSRAACDLDRIVGPSFAEGSSVISWAPAGVGRTRIVLSWR